LTTIHVLRYPVTVGPGPGDVFCKSIWAGTQVVDGAARQAWHSGDNVDKSDAMCESTIGKLGRDGDAEDAQSYVTRSQSRRR
jgi:hypothetical protein